MFLCEPLEIFLPKIDLRSSIKHLYDFSDICSWHAMGIRCNVILPKSPLKFWAQTRYPLEFLHATLPEQSVSRTLSHEHNEK